MTKQELTKAIKAFLDEQMQNSEVDIYDEATNQGYAYILLDEALAHIKTLSRVCEACGAREVEGACFCEECHRPTSCNNCEAKTLSCQLSGEHNECYDCYKNL